MGLLGTVINYEIFRSISSIIPFYMFLIIVSLIFASTLTLGSVSQKLKFGYLILISILAGSILLAMFYYLISMLHISISITGIVIGFMFILGIMMIVLLSSKKEHLSGMPNVKEKEIGTNKRKFEYTMKQQPNHTFTPTNRPILADGTPCIATRKYGKKQHYFTTVKDGVCGTFKSKYGDYMDGTTDVGAEGILYGDELDDLENNIYGEGEGGGGDSVNQYGLGVGTDSVVSAGDLAAQQREREEAEKEIERQMNERIQSGDCTKSSDTCIDTNSLEEEGINPQEYMIDYCKKNCGDFCGFNTTIGNMQTCCTTTDSEGDHIYNVKCEQGSFNGVKYSPSEVMSMTKCLPLTSDFNYSCQYANPPCSQFKDESSCSSAKEQCTWNVDSNGNSGCYLSKGNIYKYSNYIPQDFGYKKVLKGVDGNCPNTYGRAICSPDYYSGVRKIPNSTDCQDMDSTNFVDSCIDNYGYNQNIPGRTNSFGCSPNQTRKLCKKNKSHPIKYVGCYVTKGVQPPSSISSAMECISACNVDANNKYAAITKGNQCICSPTFVNFVMKGSNDCDIPCGTGFTRNCGGSNASSVYKL